MLNTISQFVVAFVLTEGMDSDLYTPEIEGKRRTLKGDNYVKNVIVSDLGKSI